MKTSFRFNLIQVTSHPGSGQRLRGTADRRGIREALTIPPLKLSKNKHGVKSHHPEEVWRVPLTRTARVPRYSEHSGHCQSTNKWRCATLNKWLLSYTFIPCSASGRWLFLCSGSVVRATLMMCISLLDEVDLATSGQSHCQHSVFYLFSNNRNKSIGLSNA